MKKLLPLLPPALLLVAMIAACEKAPPVDQAANNEAEIERRVQERLTAERQADQAQQLQDRDAVLRKKEQDLADREAALQKERDAAAAQQQAQSAPSAPQADDDNDAPPTVVSQSVFYDALAPYGTWLQVPGRDYVWQPFVAQQSPNWRPYQQGRWAYTDQGWTWISDEPFGWATYHYGRWTRLRDAGWVWVPGDEWAPAWVSWRSSDDYVGWSPLPPQVDFGGGGVISYDVGYAGASDFCFVPIVRFCEPRVANYIVAPQYNTTIINKTVNITKIIKVKNANRVVINNNGPLAVVIQNKTGRPVRQLQIRAGKGGQNTQVTGNTLQVAVPPPVVPNRQRPQNVRPLPAPSKVSERRELGPTPRPAPANETLFQRMQRERSQAAEAASPAAPNAQIETPEQQLRRQQQQRQSSQNAPVFGQPTPAPRDDGRPRPLERGQRQQPSAEERAAAAQQQAIQAQQAAARQQAVLDQQAAQQQRALQQQQAAGRAERAQHQAERAPQGAQAQEQAAAAAAAARERQSARAPAQPQPAAKGDDATPAPSAGQGRQQRNRD